MANLTVSLVIRYRDSKGKWHRSLAARGKNGRVRPGFAQIGAKQIAVTPYTYDLRYYENRSPRYMPVGDHATDADAARVRREKSAVARVAAKDAGMKLEDTGDRKSLSKAAAAYIADARSRGASEAAEQARLVLNEFQVSSRRTYLDEITREDILRYHEGLRRRGCAPRTVANKHRRLRSFLLFTKIDSEMIPPEPRYDTTLPTVYTKEQTAAILHAADPRLRVVLSLALKCGLRDQEIAHLEWEDIEWDESVLRVRSKVAYGFEIKDSEERDIPIPEDLLVLLDEWRKANEKAKLVCGADETRPDRHLLRALKALARRAGLNCGMCDGCKSSVHECRQWTLHKFRRTYATTLLRSGIDLRTVQAFMGHADMSSTMRYLRPAASDEVRTKINAVVF